MRLKSELYSKEQDDIIQRIINILELDSDNSITLYELDNNEDKKNALLELIPTIRKYFTFGQIKSIVSPEIYKRAYLSIIKNITKKKYNILSTDFRLKIEDKIIRTKRYVFIPI